MVYDVFDYTSRRDDGEGAQIMANFVAEIVEEIRIVDGMNTKSVLRVQGFRKAGENEKGDADGRLDMPIVEVDAEAFPNMAWVVPNWGTRAVIFPGPGVKDDLRTMIQITSKPKLTTIYRHTGWTDIGGKKAYIHGNGAITADGNDPSVTVRLPNELRRFNLSCDCDEKQSVQTSLRLLDLANKEITWPALAASIAPVFGPVDFALHLAGRTGTYKSECISLFQSMYGHGMDARNLPGSWSSTPNALEAQAYLAKNAAFVVDDFVPHGSSWQVRAYQQNADKIIRAQGNQAGRARLTDTSNLQPTMYPRGIILSTGEDVPEGHSVRARLLILELSPGDVSTAKLTELQRTRKNLPGAVAGLAKYLATAGEWDITDAACEWRDKLNGIGHSRTPSMLGRMIASAEWYLEYARSIGAVSDADSQKMSREAAKYITAAGNKQMRYLEEADPVDIFLNTLRHAWAAGLAHLRSMNGGVPTVATQVGWVSETSFGELPTYKAKGPTIGWVDASKDEIYIDVTSGYNVIKKIAGADMPLTKQTMIKRLKDAGILTRLEDNRERNTVRITADGHARTAIAMQLSRVTENQEAS